MPAFHLLRCMVALAGDQGNVVSRDRSRPIVFPELPILQNIHGEEAITEVYVVGTWNAPNEEVLARVNQIYTPEVVQQVFPGVRPRLPLSDPSIPLCTLPVYKPRPVRPDSPDPKLRPLDQFTMKDNSKMVEAPPLPKEDDPTPDEIAAHTQEDEDEVDLGLVPLVPDELPPRPVELPHIVRDTHGRGSSRRAPARPSGELPDVNAGGSHGPDFTGYTSPQR